jgi:hypothetical protein
MGQVTALCGPPAHATRRIEERLVECADGIQRTETFEVEEWIYDPGPGQFLRMLTFVRGRLERVSYGDYSPAAAPRKTCERTILSRAATTCEVYLECGEPAQRDAWVEEIEVRSSPRRRCKLGCTEIRRIAWERWTYNFGPRRFVRILTFRSGRMEKDETGGWGY